MDINQVERVIQEYGAPSSNADIIRMIQERHDVDATRLVAPNSTFNYGYGIPEEVRLDGDIRLHVFRQYADYRARNRMSRPVSCSGGPGIINLGRSSSPAGPVYLSGVLSNWISVNAQNAQQHIEPPVPVVFDSNNRLDTSGDLIGDVDHIRVQCYIPESSFGPTGENVVRGISSYRFTLDANEVARRFEVEGWTIVRGAEGTPFFAVLPEESDPNGRNLVIFQLPRSRGHLNYITRNIVAGFTFIKDRWQVAPSELSAEVLNDIEVLQFCMPYVAASNEEVARLDRSVNQHRADIESYGNSLATAMRRLEDDSAALSALRGTQTERVLTQMRAVHEVVDRVKTMRPVRESGLVNGDMTKLEFITHPFGMSYRGVTLRIPPIKYTIDMAADSYSRGIRLSQAEAPWEGVEGEEYFGIHPHISMYMDDERDSLHTCWGSAGRQPLPEAWASRNWTNLVRILLSWHTQYYPGSPLVSFEELEEMLPRIDTQGWLDPDNPDYNLPGRSQDEQPEASEDPAPQDEQVVEVNIPSFTFREMANSSVITTAQRIVTRTATDTIPF